MKEKLYTIPLNDAVNANDECPFCFIERNVEQDLLDYCIGSKRAFVRTISTKCFTMVMHWVMHGF